MSQQALHLIAQAKQTRATRLDLGNCALTELPDALFELTWLEELIIGGYQIDNEGEENNIKLFNPKIKLLRGLKKLIINRQKALSDLTPLTNLTALQYLDVNNTQVSDLTPLTNLTALQTLDVQSTQVSDFGEQNIQKYAHQFFMSDSVVYADIIETQHGTQYIDKRPYFCRQL